MFGTFEGGMLAESKRMNNQRFPNKKFRRFINITQFMIFSNNMEYDAEGGIVPIQGAFYCTAARKLSPFNCFREENPTNSHGAYRSNRTGEDIDMLNDSKQEEGSYQSNSDSYKNDVDGA